MAVRGGYNGLVIDKPDHEQDTDALLKEAAEALAEMMGGKDTSSGKFALDGTVITSEMQTRLLPCMKQTE